MEFIGDILEDIYDVMSIWGIRVLFVFFCYILGLEYWSFCCRMDDFGYGNIMGNGVW